jgi:hypothetical protein
MNAKEARAISGETTLAFHLGQDGYVFFEAPSSSGPRLKGAGPGGHGVFSHGFDGVGYNPRTGEILLYDNKAWKKTSVREAPALKEHLGQNLDHLIEKLEDMVAKDGTSPAARHAKKILPDLKKARKAVKAGKGWPKSVSLAIGNFGGRVRSLAKELGIKKLIDYREVKRLRKPLLDKEIREIAGEFAKRLEKWEPEAATKLSKAAARRLAKKIEGAVADHAAKFLKSKMGKFIAKTMLNQSAKKAAKRAASFVPLVGWVFNFEDIGNGLEDVFRGHVARGLGGIGLAVGDMISDVAHVGDAVSGVGGTALSLGLQAGAVAGQIAIELDRVQDRMDELGEEVKRLGALPDDGRLRSYYQLEDEDIAELKKQFNDQDDEDKADEPINLPPLPPESIPEPPVCAPELLESEPFLEPDPTPPPAPPKRQAPSSPPAAPAPQEAPLDDLIA